jgi:hypothetical protein
VLGYDGIVTNRDLVDDVNHRVVVDPTIVTYIQFSKGSMRTFIPIRPPDRRKMICRHANKLCGVGRTNSASLRNGRCPLTRERIAANSAGVNCLRGNRRYVTPIMRRRFRRGRPYYRIPGDPDTLTGVEVPRPVLHRNHPSDPGWLADYQER